MDAGQAGQRLVECAPAEGANFVARDDAHGGGHLGLLLLVLGSAHHLEVHQLLKAERGEVAAGVGRLEADFLVNQVSLTGCGPFFPSRLQPGTCHGLDDGTSKAAEMLLFGA